MKELDRSTLTLEQKFGLINVANLNMGREKNLEGALQLIREHRLGGVEDFTPGPRQWYIPDNVREKINELFPSSELPSFLSSGRGLASFV